MIPCFIQWIQAAFIAGVCNLVIVSQSNILDIFMNAAALIVIMEIDDYVGEFTGQAFSAQSNLLRFQTFQRANALANMFSSIVLILFIGVALMF